MNTQYPGGSLPQYPPPSTYGGILTEQGVRQFESDFQVQWAKIQNMPPTIAGTGYAAPSVKGPGVVVGDGVHDDTAGLQSVINSLIDASYNGGTLVLPPGKYNLSSTITIQNAQGLHIAGLGGHQVQFTWAGTDPTVPMFKLIDTFRCVFENFNVNCSALAGAPVLHSVFWSQKGTAGVVVPSNNHFENITIYGTNGGLKYGWYFTPGSADNNNDLNEFRECQVYNYVEAAWYIEHSQSVQHRFYGCAGNTGKYIVQLAGSGGQFHWENGGGGNCSVADFYFTQTTGGDPITITGHDSEGSKRLLESNNGNWSPMMVAIRDTRFADNAINADGYAVKFQSGGPFIMDNVVVWKGRLLLGVNSGAATSITLRSVMFQRDISTDPDYNSPFDFQGSAGASFVRDGCAYIDQNTIPVDIHTLRNGVGYIRAFDVGTYFTQNTAATTISNVYNGQKIGDTITLVEGDTNTTLLHGTSANQMKLKASANAAPGWGTKRFVYNGTLWLEA